ncbi:MAG: hypothetical protein KKH61_19910 [Gammaproteobacteria bacterium]|nr:hypothetical protein [Gammaproteobacteria bacterium]
MPKPNQNESKQDYLKRCTGELVSAGDSADQAYAKCNAFWQRERPSRQALNLTLPVELTAVGHVDAANPDKAEVVRKFAVTAYTGKQMKIPYMGNFAISVDGIQTKEKMPVLREHARDRVIGHGKAFKDNGALYVTGDFSKHTTDAREVLALADEGYPWQASVAVWPTKVQPLADEKSTVTVNGRDMSGPGEVWLESKVGEVSFVSLGRDDDTAAISLANDAGEEVPVEIVTSKKVEEGNDMPITIEQLQTEAPELLAQIRKEAAEAERGRVTEILSADGDSEVARKAIADGIEAAACFKLFLEAEKTKRAEGLKNLAAQATPPQGQEEPAQPPAEKKQPAHLQLAQIAIEMAAKDKIPMEQAQRLAFKQNPELAREWTPVAPN